MDLQREIYLQNKDDPLVVKIDKRFLMLEEDLQKDGEGSKEEKARKSSDNSSIAEYSDQKNNVDENSDYQDMFAK